ncbi:MAG: DUF2087 domain-containing protein [Betaproteobacteria bacterium]|nr:DUF2087 domain-containing protein [Betaproteobacteria bacterium]MCC6246928.1 DUF2087 domain-containing protein [Rubrivivax sp.]
MNEPLQALQPIRTLALKDHVSLGGLSAGELMLALAVVHATLPADKPLTEREVNEALKAALAGAACWLATDHVELRRWLVDAGWLTRDGYGREYRALAHAALPPAPAPHQALARALATMDVTRWVAAEREVQERMRAERKARWAAAQKG